MNPDALPMQRLREFGDQYRLSWNVVLVGAAHSEYPLKFMREYFYEARQHLSPVGENVLRPFTSG
jgi:hypothetical protein